MQAPTPEESASRMLSIFRSRNIRSGEVLMAGHLQMAFQKDHFRSSDYEAGAKFAVSRDWLHFESTMVRLLPAGFAEM
jgi:hypothetical protein